MGITIFKKTVLIGALGGAFLLASVVTSGGMATVSAQTATCPLLPGTTFPMSPSALPKPELRSTDPVGPFPLSALVPFPWTTIDGIWTMKLPNGESVLFSFEVQAACNGRKFVRVLGFDPKSYTVTAEGVGLGLANDTMVRAVMSSANSQYMIYIRQFKLQTGKSSGRSSTVVTIRPFDGANADDVHLLARKASTLTLAEYIEKMTAEEMRRELEVRGRR